MKSCLSAIGFSFLFFFIAMTCESSANTDTNCAAILSKDLTLHVPILKFNDQAIWADFAYIPHTLDFTVINAGYVTDARPFSSCKPSTLSSDFSIQIPTLFFANSSFWANFQYAGHDLVWTLTGAGQSVNLTGNWNVFVTYYGKVEQFGSAMTITQTGNIISATSTQTGKGDFPATGSISGLNITIYIQSRSGTVTTLTGTVSADGLTMSGTFTEQASAGTWRGAKIP